MSMRSDDSDYDNYTETSDSEDHDSESTYGGNAQSILSSLDESIGKIDDFLVYERGFVHGDVVCSITDPSGQLGRVVDVDMIVDLETRFGEPIKDVNSKKLQKIRSIASGDYVVHGPWLGRVERVHDAVTVMFNDGARCEIMTGDSEILRPISPRLNEDEPYPYYLGQRVKIKLPNTSKSVRWFCGSPSSIQNEGTICDVEVGLVHVNWIASVMMSCASVPPPHLQNPKNITLLSCFPYANWQLGDWCTLPSDYFSDLRRTNGNSCPPQSISKMQRFGVDDRHCKQMYVITKTKTKVDVLWQNGSCSIGLDSQKLFPINSVGDHDFWPGQFVLEKVISEDVDTSSCPRLGIVKNVDAQDRTVTVKWNVLEAEATEEIVSAYELIEHPDFSFCIGDIVFRPLPNSEKLEDTTQIKQTGGLNKGCAMSTTEVFNSSNSLRKEKENTSTGEAEDAATYLSYIGNVIAFTDEGIGVRWATGLTSKVQPSEIFGLDRLGDPSPVPTVIEASVPENIGKQPGEQEKKFCLNEGKAVNNSSEAYEKEAWGGSSLFFPCASVGFFKSIATRVFGSGVSSFLLGFGKGVPEFQMLKSEEAHLDGNDIEPQNLKQQVEESELSENLPSPGGEEPRMFKQFDTVDDYSDHHFVDKTGKGSTSQVRRGWLKKVQQEWRILRKDLPDNIYVRAYEERMDLMRACIVGSPGTPYHDGLFFFDVFFPPDYPQEPPMVHYNSGGLRLNPNLYESGKVCLSLLNTWTGTGTEVWDPESSTVLQVLLSLQALVLNDKPYFNEAGYDEQMGRAEGVKNSITYNENAFLLSCKSMLYILRKPPKHFEELVEEHFTRRSHHILRTCQVYMDGAPVGCPLESVKATGGVGHDSCSTGFKLMLGKLFPKLVSGFTERGIDCSDFAK